MCLSLVITEYFPNLVNVLVAATTLVNKYFFLKKEKGNGLTDPQTPP